MPLKGCQCAACRRTIRTLPTIAELTPPPLSKKSQKILDEIVRDAYRRLQVRTSGE